MTDLMDNQYQWREGTKNSGEGLHILGQWFSVKPLRTC